MIPLASSVAETGRASGGPPRILHLEDNESDGELVAYALRKAGLDPDITRVESRQGFALALERGRFDLIVSDFSLPDFDGLSALAAVRQRDRDIPFIFVSGTIGEERAIDALRQGANDYILKDRLSRLPAAVQRALDDRRASDAQRAGEEQIREQAALLDNAREAIVVKDLRRQITYWNHGAETLYGWSAAEAKAGEAEARFGTEHRADMDAAWESCLEDGTWDGCVRQFTRDGREIIVEGHWTCVRNADGSPRSVLSIGTDITRARSLELQLMRAQRLETVGMIAGGIAHDLNNVLAPILIGVASLKRKVADEGAQRLLGTMEVAVERGTDIVRQVLTFARGRGPSAEEIDVREMIRGIERLVIATLPKNVKSSIEIPDGLWSVPGDATQIQQVLLNLCVNARDAMPRGGHLTISAGNVTLEGPHAGRYVEIRVADTGHGMPPEIRERVFEAFFTTKPEGTGIGLSTVASIVKNHGGFIELESEPGRGTTFRIFLPLSPRLTARRTAGGAGQTLLVVEEGSVREIVRGTLEAYGYTVLGAETSAQALTEYAGGAADIAAVLVNMSIPNVDGVELIRQLASRNPRVKVINTSGLNDALHVKGVESVVRATLAKPYTADRLLSVVGQVLEMA
jgi:two-component system, cell cycle sensor histidine kinase and response regulator CckA